MGRSLTGLRAYGAVLGIPGARSFVAAGLIGRMPMATLSLATVFLLTDVTGSYATAGAVSATGALGYALLVPQIGHLVDRLGQRRVLRPMAWAFAGCGAAFVAAAQADAPRPVLYAAGVAFCATMPPLSALVRARWSHLAAGPRDPAGDGRLLTSAYSFESVVDELIFVAGPLLVSAVVLLHPAAGVTAVALTGAAGCLLLAAQHRTEPPPAGHSRSGGRAMAVPGLRLICGVYVCTAGMFAGWELSTIAFVEEEGSTWMTGAVMAAYALGSAAGGLWYGARAWRMPLDRRFLLAVTAVVLGVGPLWAMPSVAALGAFSLFSGVLIAPLIISGYSLVRQGLPARVLTEGMAWMSTAVGIGKALGVLTAGLIIEEAGPRWGYAFTLGCGVAGLVVALLGASRLRAMAGAGLTPAA